MVYEPLESILRVIIEPTPRATQAETVAPVIHILHEPIPAGSRKLVRQQDLKVTDRALLETVATCIAF